MEKISGDTRKRECAQGRQGSEWTPGPWRFFDCGDGNYRIEARQGPLDVSPATAHGLADARLIAAAPDLIEACRIARAHAAIIRLAPERRHTIAVLDAALAKAHGETP